MNEKRKPEWTPLYSGKEFATSVVTGKKSVHIKASPSTKGKKYDLDTLVKGVLNSERTLLAKAITLIESNAEKHFLQGQELIQKLLPYSGNSIRIGITGVPGAGKSTFIESFGLYLIEQGHKVAVLAIDPSSTISKGSILGDKTRMETLSRNPNSFIRPSPSAGILGGVARKTRETIILCEAAGYDIVLIETVGVGQSETTVRSMVDFFLLMQIAGAGDELQGIKRGILELADLIVFNKTDGDNIQRTEIAKQELQNVLHYMRNATEGWQTNVVTCSAINKTGLDEIWHSISEFYTKTKQNGIFAKRRAQQNTQWFENLITEAVLHRFYQKEEVKTLITQLKDDIAIGKIPIALAVSKILKASE